MRFRNGKQFIDFQLAGTDVVVTRSGPGQPDQVERRSFPTEDAASEWIRAEARALSTFENFTGFVRTGKRAVVVDETKRAELLAAVIAAPDDDQPRQVMADWLTEQSDPYGELILVQLALAGALSREVRPRMQATERAILNDYAITWFEPFRKLGAAGNTYRRGFIEELTVDAAKFRRNGKKLVAMAPIRKLRVIDWRPEDRAFIKQRASGIAIEWGRRK